LNLTLQQNFKDLKSKNVLHFSAFGQSRLFSQFLFISILVSGLPQGASIVLAFLGHLENISIKYVFGPRIVSGSNLCHLVYLALVEFLPLMTPSGPQLGAR